MEKLCAALRAVAVLTPLLLLTLPARADDVSAAREHFRKGSVLYDLQRYSEAAREYEMAYEAKDDPALLFNIAQAYRLGLEYQKAIGYYRAFLRRNPNAGNRDEVLARIAEMQRIVDDQRRTQGAPPLGTMPPTHPDAHGPPAATVEANPSTAPAAEPSAPPAAHASAPTAATPSTMQAPLVATKSAEHEGRATPVYKKWWLWTIVGVVAAGAAVGIAVGVTQSSTSEPTLNPVHF